METDKIILSLNTRYLTCTYHKLPEDFHVKYSSYLIRDTIEVKLKKSKKTNRINEIIIINEPYNYEKYPEHKGLVHLHALVVLSKPLRINSQKIVAKILSFMYNGIDYYPHISVLHSYKGYVSYITKLQAHDPKYCADEYYVKLNDVLEDLSMKSELEVFSVTLAAKLLILSCNILG